MNLCANKVWTSSYASNHTSVVCSFKLTIAVPPSCSLVFQYEYSHFSVFCMHAFSVFFEYFTKSSIYNVCTKFPQFSVFFKFYQYLGSEFSKNTEKSVYLEALPKVQLHATVHIIIINALQLP